MADNPFDNRSIVENLCGVPNPFLATVPVRKSVPIRKVIPIPKTSSALVQNDVAHQKVTNVEASSSKGIWNPFMTAPSEAKTSNSNLERAISLTPFKLPTGCNNQASQNQNISTKERNPIHFAGNEKFKNCELKVENGFVKVSPEKSYNFKHNQSFSSDSEEEYNPHGDIVVAGFGLAATSKTQKQGFPHGLQNLKISENVQDEDEDLPSPRERWRFSGLLDDNVVEIEEVILSEDEEKEFIHSRGNRNPRNTSLKRALELDTPPYMFFNPENRIKKKRKTTNYSPNETSEIPLEIRFRTDLRKYWTKRYQLFSKYDLGIKLDVESWFSVTPENIAIHIAERCATDGIIVDAFCGCGGNTIQFAKLCGKVISIDIDPVKIENARHNARIYGVEDKITFVVADFMSVAPALKANVVFLSPPWGGPEYGQAKTFNLKTMIPMDGLKVFELAEDISSNIAYYVPRNVDRDQLAMLSGPGKAVEIEKQILDNNVKALTAYYGDLISS